jgi:carbon-monoxide dehydrogenase small subunit
VILINLEVNGRSYDVRVRPRQTLKEILREKLALKSVRGCCDVGECGACTVLLNGRPVYSCLVLATQADGAKITTVEGLTKNGNLHPLILAFIEEHAVQCGYCIPGMILTAYYLLNTYKEIDDEIIRRNIAGNICRCSGYLRIIRAIKRAKKYKDLDNWW